MTGLLLAFEIVVLLPLFIARWRMSVWGLAGQGAILGALWLKVEPTISPDLAVAMADVFVRTALLPFAIYVAMRRRSAGPRNDVIAPNLLSWTLAITLVVMAFRLADTLEPVEGERQAMLGIAASSFVAGLFVLATSRGTFSQIIGLCRIDNAIAVFELSSPRHESVALDACRTLLLLASAAYFRWYLDNDVPRDVEHPRPVREML